MDLLNYQLFEDDNSFFSVRYNRKKIFIDRCLKGRVHYFLNLSLSSDNSKYDFKLFSGDNDIFLTLSSLEKDRVEVIAVVREFLVENALMNLSDNGLNNSVD